MTHIVPEVRITGLKTRLLAISAGPRYGGEDKIPKGRPHQWLYPLICVQTDVGIEGYTMAYGNQGDGRAIAYLLRDAYLEEIRGENPLQVEALWQKLRRQQRNMYALSDAMVGVLDVAFWDILGKFVNQPIAVLLGLQRTRVPAYLSSYSILHPTTETIYDEAQDAQAAGYRGFKLKFVPDPKADIGCIRAAREAVGPDFPLMKDGSYSLTQALTIGHELDDQGFTWMEEPLPDRQIDNLRRLAEELKTPILGGETLRLDELHTMVYQRACDLTRGDVYMKAGITGLHKACAMSELFGLNLEVHTMATPLLDVANLHVSCAVQNCEFWEDIHPVYRFALKNKPLQVDETGHVNLPKGPGLGVELDWDWIDDHTVELID